MGSYVPVKEMSVFKMKMLSTVPCLLFSRASHRYREVTGSNPFEVLNFFQASLRNCLNCVSLRRSYPHFNI